MALHRLLALGTLIIGVGVLAACSTPRGPTYPRSASAPAPQSQSTTPAPPAGKRAGGAYYRDDGPGDSPPADLAAVPDALPWNEPIRERNSRPYVVFGREYVPMRELAPFRERGIASWYGRRFHGMPTAIGEPYDMYAMTAAHPTLPLPSYARVTNVASGRSVVVRVNDRGPFLHGRVMDLSYAAASRLGLAERGSGEVEIELLLVPDVTSPQMAAERARENAALAAATGGAAASAIAPAPAPAASAAAAPTVVVAQASAPDRQPALASTPVSQPQSAQAQGPAPARASPPVVASAPASNPAPAPQPAPADQPTPQPVLANSRAAAAPPVRDQPERLLVETTISAPPPLTDVAAIGGDGRRIAVSDSAAGIYIQLGAFASLDNARQVEARLGREIDWLADRLVVYADKSLFKVQAGPWGDRPGAEAAAERILREAGVQSFTVTR